MIYTIVIKACEDRAVQSDGSFYKDIDKVDINRYKSYET
jgi:hypothetical protein